MENGINGYGSHAVTYAAIDIGSNAVRLLIKQLEDDFMPRFNKVLLLRVPLRLGDDVFSNGGSISGRRRKDLIRLMKSFKHLMKIYDVADYRACATSAMRDAANGPEIIREVQKKTGISIEIIDGQQEARMIYNNHIESMRGIRDNYIYVDVGGGSTEINLICGGELICSKSYNIGTVRILNEAVSEGEWMRFRSDLKDLAASYPCMDIVGSGGNINKLYKLVGCRDKRYSRMSIPSLQNIHDRLRSMSIRQRMEEYGLKADRADVIVPAGDIFLTIAAAIGASYIYVPVIGLSDGIIDDLFRRHLTGPDKPVQSVRTVKK